jgi:hypothetical protein
LLDLPPLSFSLTSSPLPRRIATGFILLFSIYGYKILILLRILSHSSFPCARPHPTGTHPWKDLFYPPALHFFNVYINVPGEFHLGTSSLYTLYFNQINAPPHTLLTLLYHHVLNNFVWQYWGLNLEPYAC